MMGMEVGKLYAWLGLDASNFKAGISDAKQDLTKWRDETDQAAKGTAWLSTNMVILGSAVLAAGAAARSAALEYGGMAQQIKDLSLVTDISTGKLQEFRYAAVLSGDDFGSVSASLSKLSMSIAESGDETSAAAKAFRELGVDPSGKSIDEVFEDTAKALLLMEDPTARNAIAMELYGRNYRDILPYMRDYLENIDEIRAHPVLSDDDLDRLDRAKTGWDKIGDAIYNVGAKGTSVLQQITEASHTGPGAWIADALVGGAYGALMGGETADESKKTTPSKAKPAAVNATIPGNPALTDIQKAGDAAASAYKKMASALKEYQDSLEKAAEARKKLADLEKNYQRELSTTNLRDVAGIRNLMMRHKWDTEDHAANVASAESAVTKAKGAYTAAESAAQSSAKKFGDVVVNIGNREIARVVGVAMAEENRSGGIGAY